MQRLFSLVGSLRQAGNPTRVDMSSKTLFERIIDREIPAAILHEDEHCIVFRDIAPQAPTHVLIVPRKAYPSLDALSEQDDLLAGHLLLVARSMAILEGLESGYRVVINTGPHGGQTVNHLHVHVLGGRQMERPPG